MYSEKIEHLIALALADGVLTDKQREVLLRKAAEEGIDTDEFEIVLEARLVECQRRNNQASPSTVPVASPKRAGVVKCPACGAIVPSLTPVCTECGHEFRNITAALSAQQLFDTLQDIERKKAEALRSNPLRIADIDRQYHARKLTAIRTFPVPNSKEDLIEMLTMTSSNAYGNEGKVGADEEAWIQKTDQVYQKIVLTFVNDPDTLKQATSIVASLMRRLPGRYKNFTNLPPSMRAYALAEMETARKQMNGYRNKKTRDVLKNPWIILGLACPVIGFTLMIVSTDFVYDDTLITIGFLMFVTGIITAIKSWRKIKKSRNTDDLTL